MPCPHCGKDTPGESFCSVECMNAFEEGHALYDEKELETRYGKLRSLTRDYTECPFCRLKLVLSKPRPIEEETSDGENEDDELHTLERNKFCPKCYRVYGFLIKDDLQDDWIFEPLYFEEAYDILIDLGKIHQPKKDIFDF